MFEHLIRKVLHMATTLESQVLQILANQATMLANQAVIVQNQAAALSAIQGIEGSDGTAITATLAQMEAQLTDIQSQVDVATEAATLAPAPAPNAAQ